MKNYLQIFFLILLFLILDVSSFAQSPPSPPTGGTDGDLEGNDLPIDGKLIWLAICGIIYAFYIFSKNSKTNALK